MSENMSRPTYGNRRLPGRPGVGLLGLLGLMGTMLMLGGLVLALVTALVSWVAAAGLAVVVTLATVPLAVRTADGRSGYTVLATRLAATQAH